MITSITKLKSSEEKPDWHYRTHCDVGIAFGLQRNNIGFATKMMVTTNPRILRPFSAWKLTLKCSGIMLLCYKTNFEWLMIIFLIYQINYNLIGLIYRFILFFPIYFWVIFVVLDRNVSWSTFDYIYDRLVNFSDDSWNFYLEKVTSLSKVVCTPKALICNIFIKIKENELNARFCCISIPSIIQLVHS